MERNVLRISTLLLFFFLAGCASSETPEGTAGTPPNIIYILADDLGYGELGSYGQEIIETPNLDRLAEEGMRFTQHYTGAPVCAPARCVLMTGRHAGHAHIRGNDEWAARGDVWNYLAMLENPNLEGQRPIPDSVETIGELLQGAGYKTAIVGKWGLGAPNTEGVPNKQGFDLFFGYNCQRQAHTYYPLHLWKNEARVMLENDTVAPRTALPEDAGPNDPASYRPFQLTDYAPELMQEEVLAFVEANQDRPFFLYYATTIPHLPLQAPQRWVDYYRKKLGPEAPYTGDKGYFPCQYPRATYAAMISYLDEQMGALVSKLKELGLYENTLIVFTSDNGPTFDIGGADTPFFKSAGPFKVARGWGKGFVREGGIRVPMIASWPARIEAGSTTDHLSAFYDVMPTLCDIAGLPKPEQTDGISFAPILLGHPEDQPKHEFLYWEFPAYGGQQAVRMGPWKGVRMNLHDGNTEIELYNLDEDFMEQHNIAEAHPEIVAPIRTIMEQEHTEPAIDRFRIAVLDGE